VLSVPPPPSVIPPPPPASPVLKPAFPAPPVSPLTIPPPPASGPRLGQAGKSSLPPPPPSFSSVEANYGEEVSSSKEKIPFVILDFLALAASLALCLLLWNEFFILDSKAFL
jgi:hypothetical protein